MERPMSENNNKRKAGYIVLLSTLIIGSAVLGIVLFALTHTIQDSENTISTEESMRARALADACAETSILAIKNNPDFSGTGNSVLDTDTCTYDISSVDETESRIESTGLAGVTIRKVSVTVLKLTSGDGLSTTTQITGVDWQEVTHF